MTTLDPLTVCCPACGFNSEQMVVMSTSAFGSADFDLRPPPLERFNVGHFVSLCDACAYPLLPGAEDDVAPDNWRSIVDGREYREIRSDARLPEAARALLCRSLLEREGNANLHAAGWLALNAAWVCDDEAPQYSPPCRTEAVAAFEAAMREGVMPAEEAGESELLLADILRRIEAFGRAKEYCRLGLELAEDDFVRNALDFEMNLIEASDIECHNLDELGGAPDEFGSL